MDNPPTQDINASVEERQPAQAHRLCHFFEALFNLIIVIRQFSNDEEPAPTQNTTQPTALQSLAAKLFEEEPDVVRQKIKGMIEDAMQKADAAGYPPSQMKDAKFALVAFIDEAIAFSTWKDKNRWATSTLQFQYFDRFDAGTEFFNRLDRLLDTPSQNKDVIEVYYLCLGIGFKGENFAKPDKIESIKHNTFRKLQPLSGYEDMSLSVQKATSNPQFEAIREVPTWMIYGIAAALILLLWVIASRMA